MAFLYQQKKSPFWWVEFRDAANTLRRKSTKLRFDRKDETRKARQLCDELKKRESSRSDTYREAWDAWVPQFLRQRYESSPNTYNRYQNCWRHIALYFEKHRILTPRQLSRQHVRDFIEWRRAGDRELGIYGCCLNTALHEIKLLRVVMHEAVESDYCPANPCSRLGIRKDPVAEKPEITEAEHRKICEALESDPEWMQISYHVAWNQGFRFSETCLPLDRVDLKRNAITIHAKGGKDFTAPLNKELRPLFKRLKSDRRTHTFVKPQMPGKEWWLFFKRNGLRHLCFHCTRVSFITRCWRAGIPEHHVMRLVGHASTTVHRVYLRLAVETDLQVQLDKLSPAPSSGGAPTA
jgi:integrase